MTTDAVMNVRSIGSEALAAVSDGGSGNASSSPLRLARTARQRTTARRLPTSYDARNVRSKRFEHRAMYQGGGTCRAATAVTAVDWSECCAFWDDLTTE
jgi:hypothetical protein